MILKMVCVALIVIFPKIVTTFPEQLRHEASGIKTEDVDDSANRLEEDPLKAGQQSTEEEEQQDAEALEKDELSNRKK
jgi:hypothetical protein